MIPKKNLNFPAPERRQSGSCLTRDKWHDSPPLPFMPPFPSTKKVSPIVYFIGFTAALYEPASWNGLQQKPKKLAVTEGSEFLKELTRSAETSKKPFLVTHLCTNFGQAAQLVRLGIAPAILPTIAEPYLGGTPQRIDLPWLKKYRREIGGVWHERLLETQPKARELLQALTEMPKQVDAHAKPIPRSA